MSTSNPAFSDANLRNLPITDGERMTVRGTIAKSFLLVLLTGAAAVYSWQLSFPDGWAWNVAPTPPAWMFPSVILSTILAFVIIFYKKSAPYLAPVYAVAEGLALGVISAMFEFRYPGIASQAMFSTICTFGAMLMVYRSGLIVVTDKFRMGVVSATFGIMLVYLLDAILRFFGVAVPFIHEGGMFSIAVSVVIVGVAAMNLLLDFDFVEKGSRYGAPKYMEWYSAFGLLVTLVWLYLEILRLLGKGRGRN